MSKQRLACLIAISFAWLPCHAQQGGEVSLQFLSFPKSISPQPVELLVGEGKTIEVNIPTNALSAGYSVKRLDQLVFGKTIIDEEGKEGFQVYGQAPAPTSPKQIVLLIRKGQENSDGMEIVPIENTAGNFGGGIFLFMNATQVDIAGTIGNEKFVVTPGKIATVKPQSKNPDEGIDTVHTKLYFRKENDTKPFFSSTWPLNEKARSMIFFYHDPYTKRLRLHTVRDFIR